MTRPSDILAPVLVLQGILDVIAGQIDMTKRARGLTEGTAQQHEVTLLMAQLEDICDEYRRVIRAIKAEADDIAFAEDERAWERHYRAERQPI
jgi:Mg2+ and Co2+ transporter CorA